MGNIVRKISKPIRNWNIENRAHKVISKEKPDVAPTYPSTKKQIELVNKLEPNYKYISETKNTQLDEYLKKVYVQSNQVPNIDLIQDRPLPQNREKGEEYKYGFKEPKIVPRGKLTLSQAIEILTNHENDPKKYTLAYLAKEYKLSPKLIENILEYYSTLKVLQVDKTQIDKDIQEPFRIPLSTGISIPIGKGDRKDKKDVDEPQPQDPRKDEMESESVNSLKRIRNS